MGGGGVNEVNKYIIFVADFFSQKSVPGVLQRKENITLIK